jgi:hypothetical protein
MMSSARLGARIVTKKSDPALRAVFSAAQRTHVYKQRILVVLFALFMVCVVDDLQELTLIADSIGTICR